jgi:hypothetical protein
MQITITIDRNPEGWGGECDEITAQKAAELMAQTLAEVAEQRWPEADVKFGTAHIPSGAYHSTATVRGSEDDDEREDVIFTIEEEAGRIWSMCLAEAIGETEDA